MSTALVHLIPFRSGHVQAIERDGKHWVAAKPVCDDLELAWQPQRTKLSSLPWAGITMIVIPSAGGPQETFCVDLDTLLMWLATIHANKVKPSARPALIAYQTRVKQVIADYFLGRKPASLDAAALQAAFEARLQEMEKRHAALLQELAELRAQVARVPELEGKLDAQRSLIYALQPEPRSAAALPAPVRPLPPRVHLPSSQPTTDAERRLYDHRGDAEAKLPFDYSRYLFKTLCTPKLADDLPGLYSRHEVALAGEAGRDVAAFRTEFAKLEAAGLARADWSAPLVWLPPVRRLASTAWPRSLKQWARGWERLPECALLEEVRCDLWVWMHLLDTMKAPGETRRVLFIEHAIGRRYRIQPHDGAPHLVPIGLGHAPYAKPRALLGLIDADLQAFCPELHDARLIAPSVREEAPSPLPLRPPTTPRDEILELLSRPAHLDTGLTGSQAAELLHRRPIRVKQELRAMAAEGVVLQRPGGANGTALLYSLPQPMSNVRPSG